MSKEKVSSKYRVALDDCFNKKKISLSKLAEDFPDCICEYAESPIGGFGRVFR